MNENYLSIVTVSQLVSMSSPCMPSDGERAVCQISPAIILISRIGRIDGLFIMLPL